MAKAFADLADLPEDLRIEIAANTAAAGQIVGVAVDDEPDKIARYIAKLSKYPIRIIGQERVKLRKCNDVTVVFIRIGPKES